LRRTSKSPVLEKFSSDVLSGKDQSKPYDSLSANARQAALEIVRETKTNLPSYWLK
jgi:hypothetical protein